MAGTITATTIQNDSSNPPTFRNNSVEIGTLCRAWVYYNQISQTILGSFNVSSVTYIGTGYFKVNLTTALPDTNFSCCGVAAGSGSAGVPATATFQEWTGTSAGGGVNNQRTTSAASFRTGRADNDASQDSLVSVQFFR